MNGFTTTFGELWREYAFFRINVILGAVALLILLLR